MKWSIKKINEACSDCNCDHKIDDIVYSIIMLKPSNEEDVFETDRFDFCDECWKKRGISDHPFWKCNFKEKEEDNTPRLPDKDVVMNLFKEKMEYELKGLEDDEIREIKVFRYLLGLMLERKRRLILCHNKHSEDRSIDVLFYKDSKNEDIFQIEVPYLSEEDIEYFQEKLKSLLPLSGVKRKETSNEPEKEPVSEEN